MQENSTMTTSGLTRHGVGGERPLNADEIFHNAHEISPWMRQRSEAIEAARKLPADVVQRLREAGVFRMNMPRQWGGPEMTPMQQIEVIEVLSRAQAAVGWCTMIGCDSGIYSAYLDEPVAREMYPRLDMIQAGWVYPIGRADLVEGGYRVSGTWMFGSGCTHCDWLGAGCVVYENGRPALDDQGMPQWRVMLARPQEYEILDTWHTTGARGTGSYDYRCEQLFVPAERSFSFHEPAKRPGTLWCKPDTFLRKMSGIPLGIARDAIDTVAGAVAEKVEWPAGIRYRDLPRVQTAIAEAEGRYGAARSYVFSSLQNQWNVLDAGRQLSKQDRAAVWLARTNAFQVSRNVVQLMYDTLGGSAIYSQKSPLDRHLRDIQTFCQHICGQSKGLEGVGALLLDSDAVPRHPLL